MITMVLMIFMLDGTIRENIVFGHKGDGEVDRGVWAALNEAQLADFVRSLPDGLDTAIGEDFVDFLYANQGGQDVMAQWLPIGKWFCILVWQPPVI